MALLKMLLPAYLRNLSEPHAEEVATYYLPVKWCLDFPDNERAPSHSTMTEFGSGQRSATGRGWRKTFQLRVRP